MDNNNKKKIIFLVFLGVIITLGVIVVINMLPHIGFIKEASVTAIIGGADGTTTVYIGNSGDWKLFLICSLLLIAIDLIALIIKKIIEYKRNKNVDSRIFILFILIFNIIMVLLLFPLMIIQLLALNAIIVLIYIVRVFLKKINHRFDYILR